MTKPNVGLYENLDLGKHFATGGMVLITKFKYQISIIQKIIKLPIYEITSFNHKYQMYLHVCVSLNKSILPSKGYNN